MLKVVNNFMAAAIWQKLIGTEKVKVTQLYPTLCDPMDYKSPWSSPGKNTGVVAFPFFRGSSQPRDRTQVSCIAGRFFTSWATREAWGLQANLFFFFFFLIEWRGMNFLQALLYFDPYLLTLHHKKKLKASNDLSKSIQIIS